MHLSLFLISLQLKLYYQTFILSQTKNHNNHDIHFIISNATTTTTTPPMEMCKWRSFCKRKGIDLQ